ncbi:MAG: DUF2004 domain-containing protein [Ferruginibacter sp.]
MSLHNISHFGYIDTQELQLLYLGEMELHNTTVQLDLNFENTSIDEDKFSLIQQFIENIRIHDLTNKKYILENYEDENEDAVIDYINHHIKTLPTDDLVTLTGAHSKSNEKPQLLMKKLKLARVGMYPQDKAFAVFDYSLGTGLSEYVIAVNTDENGNLLSIFMEG